ncbi:MAG: DUF3817 domain-containing protein [Lacipirellulaceae bacterium]
MDRDLKFLSRLRTLSLVEGVSTLLLFGVAMPLKYFADMPQAVRIVGSAHGFLFVCLGVAFWVAISRVPIPHKLAITGIIAAVFPFGPFLFDHRLRDVEVADDQRDSS